MAADPAVAALAAVATARVDGVEEDVRALRRQVDELREESAIRRGRDSVGARAVPWIAILLSAASLAHALGVV